MRSIHIQARNAPQTQAVRAPYSNHVRLLAGVAMAALLATLNACSNSADIPSAPKDPIEVIPNLLAKTRTAEGATFFGRGSATLELKDASGKWSRRTSKPWKLDATMGRAGIAAMTGSNLPELRSSKQSEEDIADLVRYSAPLLAAAGDQTHSPIFTGFTRSALDSTGALVEISARPGADGSPVSEIIVSRAGRRVASLKMDWKKEAGGYILKRQTASLFREKSDEAFARMTVNIEVTSVDPQGLAARLAQHMYRYASAAILPQPLHAQDCAWGILETVVGFGALVVTAPATSSGAGAFIWISGWIKWTHGLANTVRACDRAF